MKHLVTAFAIAFATFAGAVHAADTCTAQATEKKLAGAAKNSLMKKCERDSAASGPAAMCDKQAADKKLSGAAKNSFVKKCNSDGAAGAASAAQ